MHCTGYIDHNIYLTSIRFREPTWSLLQSDTSVKIPWVGSISPTFWIGTSLFLQSLYQPLISKATGFSLAYSGWFHTSYLIGQYTSENFRWRTRRLLFLIKKTSKVSFVYMKCLTTILYAILELAQVSTSLLPSLFRSYSWSLSVLRTDPLLNYIMAHLHFWLVGSCQLNPVFANYFLIHCHSQRSGPYDNGIFQA